MWTHDLIRLKGSLWRSCCVVSALVLLSSLCGAAQSIPAISEPSADVSLAFAQPGLISVLHVKEGDKVTEGQVLVEQEASAELLGLQQLKLQSEDNTQVLAAEATLEQRKVDLKKIEWAKERGSATDLELEHAQLDVKLAGLSLKVAQLEHRMNGLKYQEAKARVEKRRILSPATGVIEQIDVEVGEGTTNLPQVIRLVKIDPLWIDVAVPLSTARSLSMNHLAHVRPRAAAQAPVQGKIVFIGKVADAASETLRVRIELPNKSGRPAGEHVSVSFAPPKEEKADDKQSK